jgi:hypothetical protein
MFMLSFTGCDDDHTPPCNDQRLKYAEVEYTASTQKTAFTLPNACMLPKASTLRTSETDCTSPRASMASTPSKEDAFVEEGHKVPLAKEGDDEPLAEDGDWAGYNNEPLATRAIGRVRHARRQ